MNRSLSAVSSLAAETEPKTAHIQSPSQSLRHNVKEFVKQQFLQVENLASTDLYNFILAEVEAPMLEMVLQYVGQNQSKAARILAMSRGTLRKKMRSYGLLPKLKRTRNE